MNPTPSKSLVAVAVVALVAIVTASIVLYGQMRDDHVASEPKPMTTEDGTFAVTPITFDGYDEPLDPSKLSYVAVGDSYTCGTGTTPENAWPAVLTRDLTAHGIAIQLAGNLGIDGIPTAGAIKTELPKFKTRKPVFATLMIGVNDTYRPTTPDQFRHQFVFLIDQMRAELPDKSKLIVVTIPDYSVTPEGGMYAGQSQAGSKLPEFNNIIKEEAERRKLPVVDVYLLSREMANDPTLVADDRLHPSAKEYAIWEKQIFPVAYEMLKGMKPASTPGEGVEKAK